MENMETSMPDEEFGFWQRIRRRKLRNYLFLDKKLQFNFALLLAVIGGVNAFYFGVLFYFYSQESFLRIALLIPEYALTEDIFQQNYELFVKTIIFVAAFEVVLILLLGLFFSHRIAGPLYAMSIKLQQISRGSIPVQIRLRKHDLLTSFADRLNEAIGTLADQRGEIEAALKSATEGNTRDCQQRLEKLIQKAQSSEPDLKESAPHEV